MPGTNADTSHSVFENAFSELVRQAVRAEVQKIVKLIRDEDRLLTIESSGAAIVGFERLDLPQRKEINFHEETWTQNGSLF